MSDLKVASGEWRVASGRTFDPIWFAIAVALILLGGMIANSRGDEPPKPRLAFVGAIWCPPCKVQSRDVVPELRKRGYDVLEYDIDSPHVAKVFPTKTVPAWFVISEPFHAATTDDVERALLPLGEGGRRPDEGTIGRETARRPQPFNASLTPALSQRERGPDTPRPPPDLVALFRDNLGERASFELSLTDERTIEINGTTLLKLPKVVQCDVDSREPRTLLLTFGTPLPTAETKKLGATLRADIPEVRITGNTITATADVGLGIRKRLVFELKELPWE